MIDLPQVKRGIAGQVLVREVSQLPRGHIRIETALKYPDGTSVEVFVRKVDLANELLLTDLGQTHAWLLNVQVKPWLSRKRQAFLTDALKTYGVSQEGGELTIKLNDVGQLGDGILKLAQACLRVADLCYTRRASLQTSFVEEVEEVVDDLDLSYEPDAELEGKFGKLVRVDLLVAARTPSLVLAWSSGNASQAHTIQNEIFRKWADLSQRPEQRVTVFDDRFNVYRDDDFKRIQDISNLVAVSDRALLKTVLAA